eukprot:TRINITY_DN2648_c3_g1_i1.p1 TRINITY_DN2648_c3_g1~~TRINITY_DN2648_c3_g1_i1.p1  ORF type:complete len:341 (+),score=115.08 TRINITY_DN2648_c3_g1_i1:56-1078(+)
MAQRAAVLQSHLRPVEEAPLAVVDLSGWLLGDARTRATVAEQWDEVFRKEGFCYITGFESVMTQKAIAEARAAAADFFRLGDAQKRKSRLDGVQGYLRQGEESVGRTLGVDSPPDLVEALALPGYSSSGSDVPWLSEPWLPTDPPAFVPAAAKYYRQALALTQELMRLSEMALGLEAGYFLRRGGFANPGCSLRFAHYPAGGGDTARGDATRYAAHTDYDGFTLLHRLPGDTALEVFLEGRGWVTAVPPPGALTVNIGDLLARWTNDRWRATLHRVSNPKSAAEWPARYSVAFFTGPHPDTVVERLPCDKCEEEPAKYPPITARGNVERKLQIATIGAQK